MGVRENKVERYLHKEVTKIGGTTRKFVSPGVSGVPDRITVYEGRISFVEVKTVDGVESSSQKRESERLRACGAEVFTLYGEEDVNRFVMMLIRREALFNG